MLVASRICASLVLAFAALPPGAYGQDVVPPVDAAPTTTADEPLTEPEREVAPVEALPVLPEAPPSPQAYDAELAPLSVPPPPDPGFEIAIAMNANLVLVGGVTPSIATTTDLLIGIDPRAWIGFGLAVSYLEQRTPSFPGVPEMRFVTTTVAVPLLFQYYFAHPELGAAVPTFRLRVAGTWSETPNTPNPSTQSAGADLALYGGVTWMGASWLALRILGGVNTSFRATVVGPVSLTANVGVEALIAAVVRL